MNQRKQLHLLIGLLLVCLALLATGTYAAYTNTASVKRVVTTGIDSDAPPFSSNYLVDCSSNSYYRYRISASETENTTLYLTLFNYPRNNSTKPSSNPITYTLHFEYIPDEGQSSVPTNRPSIDPAEESFTLSGGGVSFRTYTIIFTPELVKQMEGYCLRVTATPTSGIASSCTLGADFCLVPASGRSTTWSGKWIEDESALSSLDALNFEISGTSEGTVTVNWSASASDIKLSQWCIEDSSSHDATSATFDVGGENKPTSILLQFYFVNGRPKTMHPAPNVTFTPKAPDTSSSGADSPS